MSKHSKNQTTRPFLSNEERKKFLGGDFGSLSTRIGDNSQLRWSQCRLCLCTLSKPVASPHSGALFCRACILENLLFQQRALSERLSEWEMEVAHATAETCTREARSEAEKVARFIDCESGSVVRYGSETRSSEDGKQAVQKTLSRIDEREDDVKRAEVARASPWAPQHAPSHVSGPTVGSAPRQRPDMLTRDPICGAPLRMKQLIEVKLTLSPGFVEEEGMGDPGGASNGVTSAPVGLSSTSVGDSSRFSCPSCNKPFVYQKTYLLVNCGHVFCATCVSTVAAKTKACPQCAHGPLKKAEILAVQTDVGSGFSAHSGSILEAKIFRPGVQA